MSLKLRLAFFLHMNIPLKSFFTLSLLFHAYLATAQIGSLKMEEGEAVLIDSGMPLPSSPLNADYLAKLDSVMQEYEKQKKMAQVAEAINRFQQLRLENEQKFQIKGVIPLVRGLMFSWTEHDFINHPSIFAKKDNSYKWSDYAVGGLPLAATWTLKAAGVRSRSKTERMLMANAMALGISCGASELLKQTVKETRPDATDNHSFPSGHTTIAFVSASILSREYGYISPWVTIGAYATATGTQMLRMQHNRHWVNDLYMGAGIGMAGTGLGYFLTDRILGKEYINQPELKLKDFNRLLKFNSQPSGIAFVTGTEVGNRTIDMGDARIKVGAALSVGTDLSWSVSDNWSLELMTRAVEGQTKVFDTNCLYSGDNLRIVHLDAAARLSTPVRLGERIGIRAFAGTRLMNGVSMREIECSKDNNTSRCAAEYRIPSETKLECGASLTYECLDTDNYVWGFYFDYYHTFSDFLANRYNVSTVWKILF